MCARYVITSPWKALQNVVGLYKVTAPPEGHTPRFNIAPTESVPVVVCNPDTHDREARMMRWGLVPFWAKDLKIGARMINARSETVFEKPAFKRAVQRRRCLVLSNGFYEWTTDASKRKQPWLIRLLDGEPFAMAGIWARWRPKGRDTVVDSFSILTTEPNTLVRTFHNRMPVILPADRHDLWMDPNVTEPEKLLPLLRCISGDLMEAYKVTRDVNRVGQERPSFVDEISPEPAKQGDLC